MWFLILGALLILGLALFALVATFVALAVALIAYALPIVLIVGGVWLLVRALFGSDDRHRARRDARAHQRRAHRSAEAPAGSRQAQHRPTAQRPARREVPIDVQVKAEQIRHKVELLLGYADRFSPFSQDLYLVRQIAADYLPQTIGAYLAIPGTDEPAIDATGRTALDELRDQLRLLDAKLDDITLNLQRQDLDGLLTNRRFLEERFGVSEDAAPFTSVRSDTDTAGRGRTRRSA